MLDLIRAQQFIARLNTARLPARAAGRASARVLVLAARTHDRDAARALFWLGSALRAHGLALALETVAGAQDEFVRAGVQRDRQLVLMARAARG